MKLTHHSKRVAIKTVVNNGPEPMLRVYADGFAIGPDCDVLFRLPPMAEVAPPIEGADTYLLEGDAFRLMPGHPLFGEERPVEELDRHVDELVKDVRNIKGVEIENVWEPVSVTNCLLARHIGTLNRVLTSEDTFWLIDEDLHQLVRSLTEGDAITWRIARRFLVVAMSRGEIVATIAANCNKYARPPTRVVEEAYEAGGIGPV